MRVIHVITRLIVGGAQENTITSVLGLRQKPGVQVTLLSGPTQGPEGSLESLLATYPGLLTLVPQLVRPVHPLNDVLAFLRLKSLFREARPDIVHTHSGKAGVLGRLAAASARAPTIIHTIHGPSFGNFQGFLANWLFRSAEQHAAKVTNHFVVVADAMRRQYLAAGIGRPEQYTTVRSGFELGPFVAVTNDLNWRAKLGLGAEDFVIGTIARLFKLKGHDDLFALAPSLVRSCPQARFLFVGDGEWRGRFEARARALGLTKHFIFAGLVPPADIPKYIGIMDVLVHLSLREGLARALPQAMVVGRPVVAYDCDGANEVCRDDQTGYLIRPGDRDLLQERLLLLARSPNLRERLGNNGRRVVREQFSAQRMVDDLFELYVRLSVARRG